MEKYSDSETVAVWPRQLSPKREKSEKTYKKHRYTEKELEEHKVIRELQGIFCQGRYRSWVLSNLRYEKKNGKGRRITEEQAAQ